MLVEMALARRNAELPELFTANNPLTIRPGSTWILGKLLLAGFLLVYLAGWVQDFQRIRDLEAEPTPPYKVITKFQAWDRIYRPAR